MGVVFSFSLHVIFKRINYGLSLTLLTVMVLISYGMVVVICGHLTASYLVHKVRLQPVSVETVKMPL